MFVLSHFLLSDSENLTFLLYTNDVPLFNIKSPSLFYNRTRYTVILDEVEVFFEAPICFGRLCIRYINYSIKFLHQNGQRIDISLHVLNTVMLRAWPSLQEELRT